MRLATFALAALLLAGLQKAPPERVRPVVRFHHLHYRVLDPGAWLGRTARASNGTRTIVKGVGVGVRVGREYVLFQRIDDIPASLVSRARKPSDAYGEAARWLSGRGAVVHPGTLDETQVAQALRDGVDETLDHVGFAVDDLAATVAALKETPISVTDDVATFRLRSKLVVEIVRDTDRPDAYWCPMHPDVRAPGDGRCPLCAMALVPIPPPRIGEYRVDATMKPRVAGGSSGIRLVVRDPVSGDPVTKFLDVHERPLHLFVVGSDLDYFAHVHPEQAADGSFELAQDFAPGAYTLIADFLPAEGTSQMVLRRVMTPLYSGAIFVSPPRLRALPTEQVVNGLRITMTAPSPAPRRETPLQFAVSDDKTGEPVKDLEPYLGASGHLLIVSEDLTAAIHGHPEGNLTAGPTVVFGPTFPSSGRYKMWVQFQRRGQVMTAPFVIEVPSESR